MHIREGSSANYSEAGRSFELAVTDTSDAEMDKVVAIPARHLQKHEKITHSDLPFTVSVQKFYLTGRLWRSEKHGRHGRRPVVEGIAP
jgi:hypothetical protein